MGAQQSVERPEPRLGRIGRVVLAAAVLLPIFAVQPAEGDRLRKRFKRPTDRIFFWCPEILEDTEFRALGPDVQVTFTAALVSEHPEDFAIDNVVIAESEVVRANRRVSQDCTPGFDVEYFDFTAVDPGTIALEEIFPTDVFAGEPPYPRWEGIDGESIFFDGERGANEPSGLPESGSLRLGRQEDGDVEVAARIAASGLTPGKNYMLTFSWVGREFGETPGVGFAELIVDIDGDITADLDAPIPETFDSGFDKPFCDEWTDRLPSGECRILTDVLAAGEATVSELEGYRVEGPAEHRATLTASAGAELRLSLMEWDGRLWAPVARAAHRGAKAQLRRRSGPGLFRWRVDAGSRGGAFELAAGYAAAAAAQNSIGRTTAKSFGGDFSLEALFERGSNSVDYLVSEHPAGAGLYVASFRLWVDPDLFLKGKQEILVLEHRGRAFLKLRLSSKKPVFNSYFVQLLIDDDGDGRFRQVRKIKLERGEWRRVNLEWRAAPGAGRSGGFVNLYKGTDRSKTRRFRGHEQRLDRVCLGQVAKGRKRTEGSIFFDAFRSRWES